MRLPFDVLKQVQHYRKPSVGKLHDGVGHFIPKIQQVEIRYCEHGGSSQPLLAFLKTHLKSMAEAHPHVHFKIHPRPRKHPVLVAHYATDSKQVCVKNSTTEALEKHFFNLLNSAKGRTIKIPKSSRPVISHQ